jgi:hypothetical protein
LSCLLLELGSLQGAVTKIDEEMALAMRDAGYPGRKASPISFERTPWKDDDAAWFKANPTRSHRARPAFPGEVSDDDAGKGEGKYTLLVVLLRQVKPGSRLKISCWTDLDRDTVDTLGEEYVHAWVDAAMTRQPTFTPLPPAAHG